MGDPFSVFGESIEPLWHFTAAHPVNCILAADEIGGICRQSKPRFPFPQVIDSELMVIAASMTDCMRRRR
jgi:hypothetical protein